MDSPAASNVFGYIGVVLWSVQLIPQIRWNYIRKSTEGVSILCFSCWYFGGLILAPYLVVTEKPPPLVIQISVFSILILVILFQHFFYDRKIDIKKLVVGFLGSLAVSFGIAIGLYYILHEFKDKDFEISLAITLFSAVLMAGGFIPAVIEIIRSQSAEGLSRIFVAMDFLGGTSSILSLVFIVPFDYLAFSSYIIVPIFESWIFCMSFYYGTQVKTKGIEYKEYYFRASSSGRKRANANLNTVKDTTEDGL
ncbi:hypothetical protein CYY_007178 [Polysphondylium violaceum]|uniref:Uncharacterized protein n=1 Tax=Polysphondylium violaceum TaxID=133409 RepID=A0A8J4PP00_9MYCE|nr:hypothetical protein CYY_007178 [Polysphondylium violaceum]